jgi:uncharacterized membrane protein
MTSTIAPHRVFLLIGGLNALLLTILTPPFQVHDEFQHFFRSYQLSEMRFLANVSDDRGGGVLPSSLPEFVERTWGTLELWRVPPGRPHPLTDTWAEFHRALEPDKREFADFSGAAGYSPLPYLPQAIAIAMGRLLDAPPLALMYLGRTANALSAIVLITYALRILPIARKAALVIALLPMAQFEYASVAPDAGIIATAFLFTAIALRATLRRTWSVRDIVVAVLAGLVFCTIKIVYAPLLAIGLSQILPGRRERISRRTIFHLLSVHLIIIVSVIGLSLIWLHAASPTISSFVARTGYEQKIAEIFADPALHLRAIARDLAFRVVDYIIEMIGEFGAWTVYPPPVVYVIAGVCIVLTCAFLGNAGPKLGSIGIFWNCILMGVTVGLIETAVYLVASPAGSWYWYISGVQGRYFLPLGMLAAVTAASVLPIGMQQPGASLVYRTTVVLVLLNTVIMDATIVGGFHLL